jgi:hypothetical protein
MEASASTVRIFGEAMEEVASSSFTGFAGTFGRRGHQEQEAGGEKERMAAHESESDTDTDSLAMLVIAPTFAGG